MPDFTLEDISSQNQVDNNELHIKMTILPNRPVEHIAVDMIDWVKEQIALGNIHYTPGDDPNTTQEDINRAIAESLMRSDEWVEFVPFDGDYCC